MFHLLGVAFDSYHELLKLYADPRLSDWFLMDSPIGVMLIVLSYILIVKIYGPKLMENRKPFDIDKCLIVYNFGQMLLNVYMVYSIEKSVLSNFNWFCNEVDYSDNLNALAELRGCYIYFLTKLLDLFDTVFFVLKKKFNQVTFLHVYHHSIMTLNMWAGVKFLGGGQTTLVVLVNSFVHVFMYFYYFMSVVNKRVKENRGLKRRITELQMLQFPLAAIIYYTAVLGGCNYPPDWVKLPVVIQNIIFFALFLNFYLKTYVYSKKSKFENKNFDCITIEKEN